MRKFIIGLLAGIIIVLLVAFVYIRFGFADPRADIPVGALEAKIAMPSLDAAGVIDSLPITGSVSGTLPLK